MTTKEKLENRLVNNGMFKDKAIKVFELAKPSIDEEMNKIGYRITWDRPSNEYNNVIHNMIFNKVKPFAYKWYEENLPKAWNKDMFKS